MVSIITPPPVQAQGTFSAASLSGTYSLSYAGGLVTSGSINQVFDAIGTISFDGAGKITGGSIATFGSAGNCTFTLSGAYSVSASGAGTFTPSGAAPAGATSACGGGAGAQPLGVFNAQLAASGATAVFAESDYATTGQFLSGTAVKQ
ncbi:MAG: hypothetical protein ACRD1E_00040 [Terriglobales bacterium]